MESGITEAIQLARSMGIEADLPKVPSLALGVAEISLLQMVKAYACLDNLGRSVEPNYLIKIEDSNGKTLKKFLPHNDEQEVLSPEMQKSSPIT